MSQLQYILFISMWAIKKYLKCNPGRRQCPTLFGKSVFYCGCI